MKAVRRGRETIVANLLSAARVPLAGLLWVAPHVPAWTLSVVAIAGLTDVLDGWVVRRARRRLVRLRDPGAYAARPGNGAFVDGLADKVFVVSAVLVVATVTRAPWWALVALALRELLFIPIMLTYWVAPRGRRERVDFTAGIPGKGATLAQFVALLLGLIDHPLFVEAALGAGFLGVVAVLYYVARVIAEPAEAPAGP